MKCPTCEADMVGNQSERCWCPQCGTILDGDLFVPAQAKQFAALREAGQSWRDARTRKSLTDRVYEVEEWNRLNREEAAALERIALALNGQ